MPYEKEAISDSTPVVQATAAPSMRDEAVYDPYRSRARLAGKAIPKESGAQVSPEAPLEKTTQTGHPDTSGETAVEESKPTEETVKLSPQVAALARKEQKFRQQQQALEREREAIAKEKAEIAELKAMKEKLAAKDYSGLDGLVDYSEYSQYQVNKLNGADPTQDAITELRGKISDLEKSTQENVTKQFEAAVSERRVAINKLIEENPAFPRIKKAKAQEAVVQHILDTWEHDSEELSVDQAAKEVEEILVEKAKQWAALLEEEKAAAVEDDKKTLPPLKPSLKTLTNQVTAGEIKRPAKPLSGLSDSERWAEARRRAEEKLQQKQAR